jgi:hypothetical protein
VSAPYLLRSVEATQTVLIRSGAQGLPQTSVKLYLGLKYTIAASGPLKCVNLRIRNYVQMHSPVCDVTHTGQATASQSCVLFACYAHRTREKGELIIVLRRSLRQGSETKNSYNIFLRNIMGRGEGELKYRERGRCALGYISLIE